MPPVLPRVGEGRIDWTVEILEAKENFIISFQQPANWLEYMLSAFDNDGHFRFNSSVSLKYGHHYHQNQFLPQEQPKIARNSFLVHLQMRIYFGVRLS